MQTLESARTARDAGIEQAVSHADRKVAKWSDTAFAFLELYAMQHAEFSGEDVSDAYEMAGYVSPPDFRAWGGVMKRGATHGVIERHPSKFAIRRKGHCSPGPWWVSKTFKGRAS